MKKTILIPARYESTRLPGKPIVDICGKPMICRVFEQAAKVKDIDQVIIAVDDERIADVCGKYGIPFIMTRKDHENQVMRLAEAAERIDSDLYICVNGDEPLILPENIEKVIPDTVCDDQIYAGYLVRKLTGIAEACDISNIKAVLKEDGTCLYLSRSLIPYPKGNSFDGYLKLIGVECFNKKALQFYADTPKGQLEAAEDIDHLRFIENNVNIHMTLVESESLSVDTQKDLELVRKLIADRMH